MILEPQQRPKRFILIPQKTKIAGGKVAQWTPLGSGKSASSFKTLATRGRLGSNRPRATAEKATLTVVNSSPVDGSVLVTANSKSFALVQAQAPEGAKVIEEQWYRLERPARPWHKLNTTLRKQQVKAGHSMPVTFKVVLEGKKRGLASAWVTVLVDEDKGIGFEGPTDRFGRVTFELSARTQRIDAIEVSPLHSGWPVRLSQVDISKAGMTIAVPVIDLAVADVRGHVYGRAPAASGKGVKVGVVDTGIGAHSALTVAGGRNTTEESPRRYRDEDGHGTHVAGVIAATASGWRRGEASKVGLFAYRIFKAGDIYASSFAIRAAIQQAVHDGCDLINLSIGDSMADESIRDAVTFAWQNGCVCVAAAGNDGKAQLDYPARYPESVAVTAIGLENSWPAGSYFDWTLSGVRGKELSGHETFLAQFSNRGPTTSLTAPGVAVVSTIFGNRWGVMCGTSMAAPIATGVLARRLADSTVLEMPRNAARSAAIVKLARDHAQDLGFKASQQGSGLAR